MKQYITSAQQVQRRGKRYYLCLVWILCFLSVLNVSAQNRSVRGRIIDSTNEPVVGATVVLLGTTIGTSSDVDGNYAMEIPADVTNPSLVFTFVGKVGQEVRVDGRSSIDITMLDDVTILEELVAIGYGTVKKRDITGSTASVNPGAARVGVQVSVDQMMQGRTPGVQVSTNSSEPGGGVSIRVRGTNSISAGNEPLYVIDGLPISNAATPGSQMMTTQLARNPLNAINPGDIESIEILKDASATAIYGSRGANGVILITTKKGKGAFKVDYSSYYAVQEVAKKLDMLNAREYMGLANDISIDAGNAPPFSSAQVNAAGEGTDWQDEIFRSAVAASHQLSFSGSSENRSYYASFNYLNQDGVVISSGLQRYGGLVNLNHSTKKFNFGLNLNTSLVRDDFVKNGTGVNSEAGVILAALQMDPSLPVYDSDGEYSIHGSIDVDNPVAIANTWLDDMETNRILGGLFAEYSILENLKAKVNIGSDRQFSRRDEYITKAGTRAGLQSNGRAYITEEERTSYLTEFTLNYSKQFNNDHSFSALAGYTYQQFNGRGISNGAVDFPTDAYLTNNMASGNPSRYQVGSNKFQNQLVSYLGRVNYDIGDKYLFTASFRADGSSRFGEGNKYGYFPSAALGWRISQESFMKGISALSDLKLRASYGITGNQDIGNYQSLLLLGVSGAAVFNNNQYIGIAPTQLANADLKWETTAQFNIGLDFELFNGRLAGSFDYFQKHTSDLLLYLPIPSTSGFISSLQNVGDTENKGFDFSLTSRNMTGAFEWSTTLVGSHLVNKATNLGPLTEIYQGDVNFMPQLTVIKPGLPLNSYYGWQVDGIFQTSGEIAGSAQPTAHPGDIKYKDINGDGSITVNDRTVLGNPLPDFTFGLNNTVAYKGFEFSFFFEGVLGNDMMNVEIANSEIPIEFLRNRQAYVLDRWTPANMGSENPSLVYPDPLRKATSRIVEDGSFVRLKNIRLSYNIPTKKLRSLSVFATGQNLLTFTNYRGYDPDVSAFGGSGVKLDYSTYPLARIYTIGFNVGF